MRCTWCFANMSNAVSIYKPKTDSQRTVNIELGSINLLIPEQAHLVLLSVLCFSCNIIKGYKSIESIETTQTQS